MPSSSSPSCSGLLHGSSCLQRTFNSYGHTEFKHATWIRHASQNAQRSPSDYANAHPQTVKQRNNDHADGDDHDHEDHRSTLPKVLARNARGFGSAATLLARPNAGTAGVHSLAGVERTPESMNDRIKHVESIAQRAHLLPSPSSSPPVLLQFSSLWKDIGYQLLNAKPAEPSSPKLQAPQTPSAQKLSRR